MSESENNTEIKNQIDKLEKEMTDPGFWNDSAAAQQKIAELQDLKDELESGGSGKAGKYAKNSAIVTIYAGAGGDDAEDWVRMLRDLYMKFSEKQSKNWQIKFLDESQNPNGGYRNITFEISGKGAYGELKNESGVHRLVRKSPFNSAGKRQTSFAMVEVIPKFSTEKDRADLIKEVRPEDLKIEFTKSSGPGGQNVNKRETAVRVTHEPSGISALASSERNQAQNKEIALEIVYGKLHDLLEKKRNGEIAELKVSTNTQAEWGSQIRSYVLHPYKLVKDHRTDTETSDVEAVLNGEIDLFIESMR
jgi:peptide chain release factor 2